MVPYFFFIPLALIFIQEVFSYSHTPVQYYIQTDKGPDRYFRYQTLDGQYRKEKRFEDGSVVGIYGWVGPDGLLRLYDYIANKDGYKIVRERITKAKVEHPATDTNLVTHDTKIKTKHKIWQDENRRKKFVSAREKLKIQQKTPNSIENPSLGSSLKDQRPERKKLKSSFSAPPSHHPSYNALVLPKPIPNLGYDKPGGKVTIDYDMGNNYRKEKTFPDGEVVGEHGYVDPFGILRVTAYTSGQNGLQEVKRSYWVGSRLPADGASSTG